MNLRIKQFKGFIWIYHVFTMVLYGFIWFYHVFICFYPAISRCFHNPQEEVVLLQKTIQSPTQEGRSDFLIAMMAMVFLDPTKRGSVS